MTPYPGGSRDTAPSAGRRVVAGILVALGLVALAVAALVWTPSHNIVTKEGFTEATITALRSDAGREGISEQVDRAVRRELANAGIQVPADLEDDLSAAVDAVLATPELESIFRGTIATSYRQVIEEGGDEIAVGLAAIRDELAAQLQVSSPQLAAQLPSGDQLGVLSVSLGDRAPDARRIADAADLARILPPVLLAVGILALAGGVLLAGNRRGTARTAAIGMLIVAAIPVAVRFIGPPVAKRAVDADDRDLAQALAEDALAGWWVATVAALLLAAALTVVWLTSRREERGAPAPGWYG